MSKKILIVEDDRDICSNLQELLKSEGYETEIAFDGKEAIDRLKVDTILPSLILLDLMMPGMDGSKFREEQEKDSRLASIPIVVMTADGQIESKTLRLGAKAFLRKPVDIDDFLNTVSKFS